MPDASTYLASEVYEVPGRRGSYRDATRQVCIGPHHTMPYYRVLPSTLLCTPSSGHSALEERPDYAARADDVCAGASFMRTCKVPDRQHAKVPVASPLLPRLLVTRDRSSSTAFDQTGLVYLSDSKVGR